MYPIEIVTRMFETLTGINEQKIEETDSIETIYLR